MSKLLNWKTTALSVALVSALLSLDWATAQPKPAKPAAKEAASEEAVPRARAKSGRLPPYYKDIVDAAQKNKIYLLQADCATRIEELEAQIKTLTAERDTAIANLLTAEQKEKLKTAKDGAAAKRKKPAAEKKEPAEVAAE